MDRRRSETQRRSEALQMSEQERGRLLGPRRRVGDGDERGRLLDPRVGDGDDGRFLVFLARVLKVSHIDDLRRPLLSDVLNRVPDSDLRPLLRLEEVPDLMSVGRLSLIPLDAIVRV